MLRVQKTNAAPDVPRERPNAALKSPNERGLVGAVGLVLVLILIVPTLFALTFALALFGLLLLRRGKADSGAAGDERQAEHEAHNFLHVIVFLLIWWFTADAAYGYYLGVVQKRTRPFAVEIKIEQRNASFHESPFMWPIWKRMPG